MRKHILLSTLIITLTLVTKAQTAIPNGDFENWDNIDSSIAEPTHWNSNRTGGGYAVYGPETCFRDTSTLNGGSYCVKVMSGEVFSNTVNGSNTTGKVEAPTASKADGYSHTIAGDPNYSSTFTGRPDSIAFWYRFEQHGTDYPKLEVRLHVGNAYAPETPSNNNHPDSTVNIIGRALWQGAAASQPTWIRVSLPVTYVDSRTPEYVLITMTGSGDQLAGSDSSTIWVDDLRAVYGPAGINETKASEAKVYWNRNGNLTADLTNSDIEKATIQLMNMNGQVVVSQTLRDAAINTIPTDISAGIYVYRISSAQKSTTGKVVKQ
jgi:hypothetical protein